MKKFVAKVLLVVVALTMATSVMTASAANVLHEMGRDDAIRIGTYDNRIAFVPPADVWEAATHIVFNFAGGGGLDAIFDLNVGAVVGYPGPGGPWIGQLGRNDAVDAGLFTDYAFVYDFPDGKGDGEGIVFFAWGVGTVDWLLGDPFAFITSVEFLDGPPAGLAAAAPAAEAPGVGGEVNPQTGGTFTTTALVVSGVGLVGALAALAFVAKKKK